MSDGLNTVLANFLNSLDIIKAVDSKKKNATSYEKPYVK